MNSYTTSGTQTFTLTHAKYLASKVAADLKRMQRFYSLPNDADIAKYEVELTELLKNGYFEEVTYGFKIGNNFIEPSLRYTAKDLAGSTGIDDDPGKIRPGANISGAAFGSFLLHTAAYDNLSQVQRDNFNRTLPISRNGTAIPGISGYLSSDNSYSSGGKALDRSSVKSY